MSLGISQGLQTCLEPLLAEPRVLQLKLAPPKPPLTTGSAGANDPGSWSFLLSLAGTNSKLNTDGGDRLVYVHPQAKVSPTKLTTESLAMCTEGLGSETGSENGDDISLLSLESTEISEPSSPVHARTKKQSRGGGGAMNFPPPLTSVSGSGGVQVMSHREGGRLVLKAVRVSTSETQFHAERSNGRLRLHLLTEEETEQETGDLKEGVEEDGIDEHEHEHENENDEDEEEECWGGDMEVNCGNLGGKIGTENYQRPRSRCKEKREINFGWLLKPIYLS